VLAETGIIGLALLVWFLRCIYRFTWQSVEDPALRTALLLSFWTLVFASFTEHRIVTPSNVLPFALLFGLTVADANAVATLRTRRHDLDRPASRPEPA
jgi:O-antigen ligase